MLAGMGQISDFLDDDDKRREAASAGAGALQAATPQPATPQPATPPAAPPASAAQPESEISRFLADAPPPERGLKGWAQDIGATAVKGAIAVPEIAVGLADMVTGGHAGRAAEGLGLRFKEAREIANDWHSEATKEAQRQYQQAEGVTGKVAAALQNPSVIASAVGEALPQMLAGGLIGRGLMLAGRAVPALAGRIGPALAGALGEGVVGAGSAAEQIRQESPNGLLTGRQAGLAGLSGVADAGFGLLGGKMAQRLGIGDVETMLAGAGRAAAKPAAQPVAKGLPRQMAQGALSEGVLEELPQSVTEQALQNIALDRPWQEDVDSAAVLGTLTGGVMGAGASGLHGLRSRPAGAEPLKPSQRMGLDANAGQLSAAAVVAVDSGASPAALTAAQPGVQQGALQESAEAQQAALAAGQAQGPREAAALERVAALDEQLAAARQSLAALDAQAAAPDGAQDEPQQAARAQLAQQVQQLQAERESLTQGWPRMQAGKALRFGTESGAQLAGHWALAEADQLVTSHDEGLRQNPAYPQQLQPRERSRAASEAQIARMAQRLQPERLAHSADAATGAPIVGADGLVESGNARSIALKRVYAGQGPQAAAYKDFLQAHAAEFGLTPEQVAGMQKPVLVRVRDTPVNRAEFARQANAPTVAMMSPAEQARADAARLDSMDGLEPDESGDFSGAASRGFVRRFMARLPVSEQAAMVDADGRLSSAGYARVRNAVLAKAWGTGEQGGDALARMTESLDDNTRSISRALMMAAPETARMREAIAAGARHDADIAGDVAAAAQEISRLREAGQSVQQALAQTDAFGDKHTPEARALMQFMADNARRPRRIAQLIQAYWQALDAAGDPHQQGMFGGQAAPTKQALLQAAMRQVQDAPAQGAAQEREAQDRAQAAWSALPPEGRHQLALAAGVQGVVARNAARHADWSGLPAAMQQRLAQAVGAASAAPGRDNAAHKSTHKSAHETAHKSVHESGVPRGLAARETADSRQLEGIINRNIERSGQEAAFKALAVGADQLPDALRGALAAFERATGARAVVFRNLTPHVADFNGVTVRDGTLFINETSQSPITGVAAHEWLHNLRRTHPGLYHELAAEVARQGDAPGFARQWGYAPGEAQEELTAAAVGDAMTDPQFLARLAEQDGSLFARVAKSFLAFLDTLTARWRSQGSNAYLSDVQAFRDKLAAVLQAYEQAQQAAGAPRVAIRQQLQALAEAARQPGNVNQTVDVGLVHPAHALALQGEGLPVQSGWRHTADMFAVRHALARHSDAAKEQSRGQLPLTDADIRAIADVVRRPDAWVLGAKTPRGQDVVASIARQADGTLLYVQEVRTGRRTLAMTSMRKYPGTSDFKAIANGLLPTNARSDAGNVRIVQPPEASGQVTAAMFQRVWHGTPHKGIEKTGFRLDKIGTGEGLQVYGHGIYFASRREVAEFYRGMRQGQVRLDGRLMTDGHHRGAASTGDPEVDALLLDAQGDVDKAIAWARDFGQDAQAAKLERLRGRVQRGEPGQLYAAEIPEDDDLLDWDKPLDEQPAKVRRALLELAGGLPADGRAAFRQAMARRATGQDVYAFLAQRAAGADASAEGVQKGQRAASELLLAHGIPGLRYLDGDSRHAGEGSHNYVIWDEGLLTPEAAQIAPQYSRKQATQAAYERRIDELFAGGQPALDGVRVLDRSDVLSLLGMGEGPVRLAEGKVIAGIDNHPRMTAKVWKQIPEWIENPAAVFKSDTAEGLVFLAPETLGDAPVSIIVRPDGAQKGALQAHLLLNAYDRSARTPFMRWIHEGLLKYADTKKFPALFQRTSGRQLPGTALRNRPGTERILTEKSLAAWRKAHAAKAGDAPAFSLPESRASRQVKREASALKVQQAQRLVKALSRGWANAPEVVIASSVRDEALPETARRAIAKQESRGAGGRVEGFYWQGKVYLVAGNLPSMHDVARVYMHETLGHYGLRGVYGEKLNSILNRTGMAMRGEVIERARQYGFHGLGAAAKTASDAQVWDSMTDKQKLDSAEEALAYLAQTGGKVGDEKSLGLLRELVAAIRSWLRAHVPVFANLRYSDDEIMREFILPARRWVKNGSGQADDASDVMFQLAWHGTPYRGIEKTGFKLNKIGTGEGAQAYGWGIYFASQRHVAEEYRRNLTRDTPEARYEMLGKHKDMLDKQIRQGGSYLRYDEQGRVIAQGLALQDGADMKGVVIQPYSKWKLAKLKKQAAELEAQMNELRALLGPGGSIVGGQLYQTEVPEDKDLLIWDSPWNKQPLKVRRAVVNFLRQVSNGPVHPTQSDISRIHAADALKHRIQNSKRSDALTGKDLYTAFRDIFGGPKAASEALRAAGVPGLRYLDGMSRAGGEGTYNYVIWDEALLTPEAAQIAPQYSRKQATKAAYDKRIDALFAGAKPALQGVRVLDRSDVLGLLGMSDGPVHLVESKVEQGRFNHGLTATDWKKVPEWLDRPAAVFDSETTPGRLVFIAPERVRGAPVRMVIDPREQDKGVNLLINAYDAERNPFARWEREGLLRYFDRQQAQKAAPATGSFQPRLTGLPGERGRGKILTEKHLAGWRKLHAGPAQPDAHFSRRAPEPLEPRPNEAARLKESALEQLDRVFKHPGTVSWWHKTVGTMRNLAERQPLFKPVYEAAQQFIDDVSHFANDAADFAPRLLPRLESWRDLGKRAVSAADSQAVAAPLFEGTLSYTRGKDGSLVKTDNVDAAGVVFTDAELKGRFGLTPAQIELYRQARAAIDRSIDTTARADILRLAGRDFAHLRQAVMDAPDLRAAAVQVVEAMQEVMQGDAKRREAMRGAIEAAQERVQTAQALMQRGYAPLTRFGRYTLDVVDAQGQRQYFGLYESRREANVAAIHMRSQYPGAQVTQGTLSDDAYKLFAGITPESLELFGDLLAAPGQGKDKGQEQAFQAWLQLARNNRSAIKRLIHRKGVAGYSQDAGRVLASFIYANARQTAGALNAGRMDRAIAAIPKEQGQLRDVAMALRDYTQNPREEGQAIRGMLFAQYLGGSLASAAVNMTQPFAVTLPWLSQFGGMRQAAAQMTRALADMTRPGHRYEADLARDMAKAEEDGVVSPQEIHQLMAQARGAGALRSGDGTRRGDALAAAANAWERLKVAWGQPFALAEQFNRRSTYIAAWRLARQQGMADADAFARRAVLETQFLYTKANKPRWGRGAVGGALFTFKTYSVSYLELMHRMWTQGGTPGKQGVAWMLAMLLLMGGAGGLPFMEDAEDLIDGLAQLAGYNTSVKQWRRQALQDIVGDGLAEFIESGVSGLPGAPIDISGRLGMGNLLPGTGLLLTKQNRERDLLDVAGPAGDLLARGFAAGRKLLTGDAGGAAMELAPTAVRNLAKGADMLATGSYRDAKGYKVLDTTALEALAKAAGFQPRSVAQVQEGNSFLMRSKSFYQHTSAEIKAQWARALFEKDEAALQRVRQRVADWNRRNPEQPITVRMPDIWRRVREMGKERSQRIADSAPRALRQQMRQTLAQEG